MPRHVGRIVDPDVRDDGGLEPSVLPDAPPEPAAAEPNNPEVLPQAAAEPLTSEAHSNVDAQQLAAVDLRASSPNEPEPVAPVEAGRPKLADFEGLVDDDPKQRRSRDLELDLVGEGLLARPRGPSIPLSPKAPISPQMVAVFWGFLGVLTVVTIIAIAMRLDHGKAPAEPVASTLAPPGPTKAEPPPEPPPPPKRRQRDKVAGPYRIKDSANDAALRIVEGQVGFDPFLKAVEKAGVPLKEAYRLLVAFEKVRPLSSCSRHDKFVALLDRASKRIKAFEYIGGPEEVFQARESDAGLLVAEKLDLKIKRERVTGAFAVGDTGLERSVADSPFEPAILRAMREALVGHLSLEEIERGSRVRVIAQEVTALGEFARYAGIEALEIQGPSDKKRLRVYFFNSQKSRGYYDESARATYEGGWRSPIPNAPVTSKFNMHRMHPILHKVMPHTGVDFGAATGVPIGACSFGTITFLGWGGPTGNFIRIEHPGGIETGYAHLSRFAEGLKVGDKVKRLQTIGYVGSTGRSTGPHLHFTVKRDGKFVDPLSLNLDALRVLPSEERDAFQQQKAQYDAQLDAIALPALPKSATATAAKPEPTSEGFEEEGQEGDAPGSAASSTPAPPSAGSAAAAPPAPKSGSSLYLTDEELLRMQKASESGEVEE